MIRVRVLPPGQRTLHLEEAFCDHVVTEERWLLYRDQRGKVARMVRVGAFPGEGKR